MRRDLTYLPAGINASPQTGRVISRSVHSAEVPTERRQRGARTRERIVEAAAEAFATCGYNGVNLTDVVAGLGLTKGALYYFFPTKEALALEIVTRHFELFSSTAEAALTPDGNRMDQLVEVTYVVGELFQRNPITRAGVRLTNERNTVPIDLPRPFVFWIARLTKLLRQAKSRGELRADASPKAVAELVVSFFYGAQAVSNELNDRRDLLARLDQFWKVALPTLRPEVEVRTIL